MKFIKHFILCIVIQMNFCFFCLCQSSINTDGTVIYGNGGNISYSLGQFADGFYSDKLHSINQGVQQPFEITINDVRPVPGSSDINIFAFPNPTSGKIIIESKGTASLLSKYLLSDELGNKMESGEIHKNTLEIDISHYNSNIFFLIIESNGQPVRIIKLIKHSP